MGMFSLDEQLSRLSGAQIYDMLTPTQRREFMDRCAEDSPTSQDFADKMQKIADRLESRDIKDRYYTQEQSHIEMDDLMCDLLEELGYQTGIEIFKNSPRWYS